MMPTMRELLSQNPMTFNELLDLFEAYVSTIGGPINTGHDMLRKEIGGGEHVALGHIFGVACDAEDMAKRLCQIRTARTAGSDVTITLAQPDAKRLGWALREIERMFSSAADAFELLERTGAEDMDPGALAVIALARRALLVAAAHDGAELRCFADKLEKAGQYQEDAA